MRAALIADVHANLPALRAVLDDVAAIGCDAVWCAGDVVGRGPHPNEVVELLRTVGATCVQGNWDEAVGMGRDATGSGWATAEAERHGEVSLAWTVERLADDNRRWLRNLPTSLRFDVEARSVLLFHGSPLKQNEYLWSDRPSRYFSRIASDEGDDLFCFGHTHESFHRLVGQSHFVAAGSVGCGSLDDPRARYAVVYVGQPEVIVGFRSVEYDRAGVERDLVAAGLAPDLLSLPPTARPAELPPPLETSPQTLEPGIV
ncbi:MAG TPA: metallophosphoesterase family protein [Candidatus Limnocylindria bacterium]|nr:metallophosphoesterase family protein [Candidatus Limnocylindria bacterium]